MGETRGRSESRTIEVGSIEQPVAVKSVCRDKRVWQWRERKSKDHMGSACSKSES